LALPLLTRAEEQSTAKDRAQRPDRGGCPDIIAGIVHEDVADRFRSVKDELGAAEKPVNDDLFLEGLFWKCTQRVAAKGCRKRSP
jgi:hypothetical protein